MASPAASTSEGITLDLDDAIPVALIVNELVSNCMKHAFPGGSGGGGRIAVSLREEDGQRILEVEDNGVGLGGGPDEGIGPDAIGIGTELVLALAAQVRGTVARTTGRSGAGTVVSIVFPKPE